MPTVTTLAQHPELEAGIRALYHEGWPPFMRHSRAARPHWERLFDTFPPFQLILAEGGNALAAGFLVPLPWDGTRVGLPEGWDAALEGAVAAAGRGEAATVLVALAAFVAPSHRGQGLSGTLLQEMVALAGRHRLRDVIVPVRPTLKSRYPLTPIHQYLAWKDDQGAPFDPWVRTHWRLGARSLMVAPRSKMVEGSVAEWEGWASMALPESGPYIVPGALQPVEVDGEAGRGRYVEPNLWMQHRVPDGSG